MRERRGKVAQQVAAVFHDEVGPVGSGVAHAEQDRAAEFEAAALRAVGVLFDLGERFVERRDGGHNKLEWEKRWSAPVESDAAHEFVPAGSARRRTDRG